MLRDRIVTHAPFIAGLKYRPVKCSDEGYNNRGLMFVGGLFSRCRWEVTRASYPPPPPPPPHRFICALVNFSVLLSSLSKWEGQLCCSTIQRNAKISLYLCWSARCRVTGENGSNPRWLENGGYPPCYRSLALWRHEERRASPKAACCGQRAATCCSGC